MDTGKLKNNYEFYKGFEGEGEMVIIVENHEEYNLHIWEGYFSEIFQRARIENGWSGFTKDYQECIRTFSTEKYTIINLEEYINDLKYYENFEYDADTRKVLLLIIDFLNFANQNSLNVIGYLS